MADPTYQAFLEQLRKTDLSASPGVTRMLEVLTQHEDDAAESRVRSRLREAGEKLVEIAQDLVVDLEPDLVGDDPVLVFVALVALGESVIDDIDDDA